MASLIIVRYVIGCDGCNATFGTRAGFESLTEARAAAYGEGWRFPAQTGAKGQPIATSSDVCPACTDAWQPRPRSSRQRMLTKSQINQLPG